MITKSVEGDIIIIKLNIDTNEYEEIQIAERIGSGLGQLLLINDDIHIIGGSTNTHLILQQNQTKPQILSRYGDGVKIESPRSIYSSKTDIIYTFGGYILDKYESSNNIHSFHISTNTHKLIELKMPDRLDSFGCIMTKDEKYVITFGGCDDYGNKVADIYIFDMDEMTARKSSIICPKASTYHAILMNDDSEHIMIVYGYIRWSLKEFDGINTFPSHDIINLIVKWYGEEMIYLQEIGVSKSLWRLSLWEILK